MGCTMAAEACEIQNAQTIPNDNDTSTRIIRVCSKEHTQVPAKIPVNIPEAINPKIKYLQDNKQFVGMSIQASICVTRALQTLSFNPVLHDQSYQKLLLINRKCLEKKQNRFKNLQKREEKAEKIAALQQQKQNRKRKTLSKSQKLTQASKDANEQAPLAQSRNSAQPSLHQSVNSRINASNWDVASNDYRSKFLAKIDKFRLEVNTILPSDHRVT